MTQSQSQEESVPRRCPRCGGLMRKPTGSSLYWHADNNHPRCDITNLVDAPLATQAADELSGEPSEPTKPDEPPKGKRPKK